MIAALTQLAVAAGTAAVEALAKLILRKEREPPEEAPAPAGGLTWRQVEKMRSDERSSIAAAKAAQHTRDKPGC